MTDLNDPILVAVDGGGSGCRAAIGRASLGIVAQAQAGPANVTTDETGAIAAVLQAVTQAAAAAGMADQLQDATAYLALAGAQTKAQRDAVVSVMPFARCTVTDDVPAAVSGALGGAAGAAVLIGTGTIVACTDGKTIRTAGGWGLTLSDIGSGAWLGRSALARTLEAYDGTAPASDLTYRILARFDANPHDIVAFALAASPADFGQLAPLVTQAAAQADPQARAIIQTGAAYITRALSALGHPPEAAICLGGGTGPQYQPYLPMTCHSAQGTALDGAFMLAQSHRKLRP